MKRKSILFLLLMALMAPWAANAQTTLWSENFEGGSMPTGWTTDGPGTWSVGSGDYSTSTGAGQGTYNALIKHGTTGSVTKLITPAIDLSSVTSAVLSFMHVQRSWAGDIDYLKVYYRTSTSGTWTQLVAYTSAISSWTTEEEIVLPNTTATYQLAFEYTDNYGYGVGLDQIVISVPTSCLKPAGLAATPNGQSATLTWNGDASTYHVAYSADGTANPDDLTYTTVTTNSYTKDNLAIDADHYFWVRSICSATEQSDWVGPVSVHIGYCVPAPTSVDNNGISNVTFGMGDYIVNNDTPKATYTDYTSQIGAVQAGVESTIAITFQTGYTYNTYVWVDLDNSLSFDADEVVCSGESTNSNPTTLTLNFTIPADQTLGDFRLRIGSADSGMSSLANANPCYSSTYACFQDYTLRVLAAPDCLIPTGLALTASGNTFTATWDGTADTYNIDINGTVTNNVTSPYTFTGEYGTTYTVMVQANCGGETSDWSNPQSVTTDLCAPENMCAINITLTDAYGDGGGQIQVVDVLTNEVLGTFTNANESSVSYTLNVCDGRAINFVFASTDSWSYENGWVITDINGDVISEHVGCTDGCDDPTNGVIASYTVSCTVSSCRKPTDLATEEVGKRTATISWTENGEATAWQVEVTDLDGGQVTTWNANATTFEIVGLTPDTRYSVRVKPDCEEEKWSDAITFSTEVACPAPTALEVVPTPISATVTWTGDASNYTLRYGTCAEPDPTQPATIIFHADDIWQDGSGYQMLLDADATAFGTIIPETGALSLNCSGNEDIYAEFEYKIPANADGECTTSNVIIDNTITLQIPAGTYDWCITNPTPGDRIWIASAQGNVGGRKDDYVFEAGMIYEFNMYMLGSNDATDVTIMCGNVDWTYVDNATSPYTINGLNPETEYYVGVQAVCGGEDGESAWTNATFTTPSNCDAPSNVNVPAETLMPTTAGVEWTGYQDGFEVWYRPVAQGSELASIDFEDSSMGSWTTIDADGDGYDWVLGSACDGIYLNGGNLAGTGRNDSQDLVVSGSYSNVSGALTPDNYLVSPQVELGGSITFWAAAQDASYAAEVFGVAVSTTSNTDASAFTTIQSWTMTSKGCYINDGSCRTMPIKTRSVLTRSGNRAGGTWYQYTVDLSAYAGQTGYVAIRHYGCTDQFMLDVDDITIYGPVGEEQEWMQATTDGTSIILGEDEALIPETTYECKVRGENRICGDEGYTEFSETINFTTPGLCDNPNTFTFETLEATTATLNWIGYQESYNVLYRTAEVGVMLWEDFSNGASGWTASDLNEQSSIYTLGSGEDTWKAFGFVGDGTTQYLISPELESSDAIADSLYFYYYAYQGSTQTFKVGFSETYSLDGFTWGDEITTSSSDYYGYYEGVIPAGTKYFAIQSSGESSYLFVTDFYAVDYTNYVAAGEWVELTVNEPSVTMQPLTPNTVYDVYVQGICGEGEDDVTDWMGGYFTTPELTTLTQTIELAEGSSWISFYVETDLDALKAALEEVYAGTNMMIQGKNAYTTYNGSRWRGPLTSLDMSQMYMIEVAEVGRIVVEGEPLNPADLAITINEGANWIGFPFSVDMAVNDAFAGFAVQDDMIQGRNGYTTYNGTTWRGTLRSLTPGQGYIYNSTTDKGDFYYPTNTSKAGQTTLQLKPFAKNRFEKKSFVPANIMPISK